MPASLLTTGDNVIAVETHVNYTRSATVGMWASVIRVDGTPESTSGDDDVKPEPEPQPDPNPVPVPYTEPSVPTNLRGCHQAHRR